MKNFYKPKKIRRKKTDVEIAISNMDKYNAGKIKCPIQGK